MFAEFAGTLINFDFVIEVFLREYKDDEGEISFYKIGLYMQGDKKPRLHQVEYTEKALALHDIAEIKLLCNRR